MERIAFSLSRSDSLPLEASQPILRCKRESYVGRLCLHNSQTVLDNHRAVIPCIIWREDGQFIRISLGQRKMPTSGTLAEPYDHIEMGTRCVKYRQRFT
jgi:hypothetical protein